MLNSFRARIFFFITALVLLTALSISVFQQLQIESFLVDSEISHARNLLKMATLQIETQHESLLFHREALMSIKKNDLQNMIAMAFKEANNYYGQYQNGIITEEEARQKTLDFLRRIHYAGDSGYIWVNTDDKPHPVIVMHPTMPEIIGKRMDSDEPLFNQASGKNKNLFAAFVEACEQDGHGFVNYIWPKPTSEGLSQGQPKLSFVKKFAPWHWIIGTGLYIDDIESEEQRRMEAIVKELRKAFAKIKLSENSYLYLFNSKFEVLVHPIYAGRKLAEMNEPQAEKVIMERLMTAAKTPDKPMVYHWEKPDDSVKGRVYRKMAFVEHFAPLDWYIVAAVYQDDFYAPLASLRWKIIGIITLLLSLALFAASMLARNLSKPLQELAETARKIETTGISTIEIPTSSIAETRQLSNCLHSMLMSIQDVFHEKNELLQQIQSEEEKFRTTLNSIADAVISTDISGKILGMNPVAESLTGWKADEGTGRDLAEVYRVFRADNGLLCSSPVDKILEGNGREGLSSGLTLKARNGQEYHIAESGAPIRNETGEIKGVVLTFRNVTEEYGNQQKLKEAEWKFHALFENGPLGVAYHRMIYDESGKPFDYFFIDANSNYRELTGVDPRGKTVREAFPGIENDSFDWIKTFGRVAKTGESTKFEQYLQVTKRWYDVVSFQYKPDHFVAAFFETTEQRKLEQQLRQAQKMDAIGQLAGGIAHDFNNVLGGILGAAELLAMEIGENERTNRYLALIQDSSERAADLVRKLMAFGRQNNLVSTPVDAHAAAREAVALLTCSVDKKVKIALELSALQSMVIGDLSQLQNVFLNLGINASHAMPDGGLLTITSSIIQLDSIASAGYCVEPGNFIKFEVRDTGCGIKAEDIPRIFEPFFTTKATGKGTGLGLAAAFGIVKQHRGAITVYSEVGVGTVFHVLLPLTEKAQVAASATQPLAYGHGCILVVDDEQIIRTTASAILKQLGYEVLVASNGLEGLEIFKSGRHKIDLVMLDMIMPVMNGRECFERIKEIDPAIKVIMASGFCRDEDLQKLKALGLGGFIQKPYGVSDLSHLLEKVLKEKTPKSD